MENLKKFRESRGYTQLQVAEMLKTTQQTIARWESGKAEPNIAALRDLSMIFETSIDDLLGRNPLSDSAVTTSMWSLDKGDGHFWGHLGVQLPGDKVSRWYPVTLREADAFSNAVRQATAAEPWVSVPTLNNRMLVMNALTLKSVALLDDDADQMEGDWELGWDSYYGYPLEVYRGLADLFSDAIEFEASDTFKKTLDDIVDKHKLTRELVDERILRTVVHYRDGSTGQYDVEQENLWDIVEELQCEQPTVFDLSHHGLGYDRFVGADAVHLIDMPLHMVIDAAREEMDAVESELEDEDPNGEGEKNTAEEVTKKPTAKQSKGKPRAEPKPSP